MKKASLIILLLTLFIVINSNISIAYTTVSFGYGPFGLSYGTGLPYRSVTFLPSLWYFPYRIRSMVRPVYFTPIQNTDIPRLVAEGEERRRQWNEAKKNRDVSKLTPIPSPEPKLEAPQIIVNENKSIE